MSNVEIPPAALGGMLSEPRRARDHPQTLDPPLRQALSRGSTRVHSASSACWCA
jgi:hypothetical protein